MPRNYLLLVTDFVMATSHLSYYIDRSAYIGVGGFILPGSARAHAAPQASATMILSAAVELFH
jgi:hypothetical protein